jgi:hypothetical protein
LIPIPSSADWQRVNQCKFLAWRIHRQSDAADDPSLINNDPYGAGWLFKVRVEDATGLLTAGKYAELTGD